VLTKRLRKTRSTEQKLRRFSYLALFGRIEHYYFRSDWRGTRRSVGLLILENRSEISDVSDRRIELDRSICDLRFLGGRLDAWVQVGGRVNGGRRSASDQSVGGGRVSVGQSVLVGAERSVLKCPLQNVGYGIGHSRSRHCQMSNVLLTPSNVWWLIHSLTHTRIN
jgi:hypothetical protein